jgi:hypothetical protein
MGWSDAYNALDAEAQHYTTEGTYSKVTNNCNVWVLRRISRLGLSVSGCGSACVGLKTLPLGAVASYPDLLEWAPFAVDYLVGLGIGLTTQNIQSLFYDYYGVKI